MRFPFFYQFDNIVSYLFKIIFILWDRQHNMSFHKLFVCLLDNMWQERQCARMRRGGKCRAHNRSLYHGLSLRRESRMYSSFYDDTKSETLANPAACRATEREKKSELPSRRFFLSFFFLFFISTVTPLVVFNRARRNCQNSFSIRGDAEARRGERGGGKKESDPRL